MNGRIIEPQQLVELYREGTNIMAWLRARKGQDNNDEATILASYDLQAGSYVAAMADPALREIQALSAARFAAIFDEMGATSLLEAGVGEATTLCQVLRRMRAVPAAVLGFDISFSRIRWARAYARATGCQVRLFTSTLERIALPDSSVDVVYTSHALEPNRGRESELLAELLRVTRRYLVLREPSDELGGEATRATIERHRYVRGLRAAADGLGCKVIEHSLWGFDPNPNNQAALMIIEKSAAPPSTVYPSLASPIGRAPLVEGNRWLYSAEDCLVFPVIEEIPCLLPDNGVFAAQLPQAPAIPAESI